jgi:hypothetical protein
MAYTIMRRAQRPRAVSVKPWVDFFGHPSAAPVREAALANELQQFLTRSCFTNGEAPRRDRGVRPKVFTARLACVAFGYFNSLNYVSASTRSAVLRCAPLTASVARPQRCVWKSANCGK